jgi:hypothetical protein
VHSVDLLPLHLTKRHRALRSKVCTPCTSTRAAVVTTATPLPCHACRLDRLTDCHRVRTVMSIWHCIPLRPYFHACLLTLHASALVRPQAARTGAQPTPSGVPYAWVLGLFDAKHFQWLVLKVMFYPKKLILIIVFLPHLATLSLRHIRCRGNTHHSRRRRRRRRRRKA